MPETPKPQESKFNAAMRAAIVNEVYLDVFDRPAPEGWQAGTYTGIMQELRKSEYGFEERTAFFEGYFGELLDDTLHGEEVGSFIALCCSITNIHRPRDIGRSEIKALLTAYVSPGFKIEPTIVYDTEVAKILLTAIDSGYNFLPIFILENAAVQQDLLDELYEVWDAAGAAVGGLTDPLDVPEDIRDLVQNDLVRLAKIGAGEQLLQDFLEVPLNGEVPMQLVVDGYWPLITREKGQIRKVPFVIPFSVLSRRGA